MILRRLVVALSAVLVAVSLQSTASAAPPPSMTCPVPASSFVSSFGAPRVGHTHQGVDMMAPDGTPIYAPESGTYRTHGNDSFYLDGASGTTYFGTHLQGHARGDGPVNAGELVAYVGHTGNASADAPHLHFEIHPAGGSAVDPYPATSAACNGPSPTESALRFVAEVGAPPVAPYTPSEVGDFVAKLKGERPTVVESYAAASMFNRLERQVAEPTYPYTVREVRLWWNATHNPDIDRVTATRLAAYFTAIVEIRLGQYLLAVYLNAVQPSSCSGPADCAAMVRSVFASVGVDGNAGVRVATCESGLNPRASNGGRYLGLFQQAAAYWAGRAAQYGMAGRSAFDGYANAYVSARMVRDGGWGPWECTP